MGGPEPSNFIGASKLVKERWCTSACLIWYCAQAPFMPRCCKSAFKALRQIAANVPRVSGCCRSGTAEVPQKRSRPRNGAAKAILKRGTAKVPQKRCCINASEPLTEPHWVAAGSGQEGAHFAVQGGTGYMCVTFFIWDAGLVQHNPPRNIS